MTLNFEHACVDWNEQGYCRECGNFNPTESTYEPPFVEPCHLQPAWPRNTWFQNRRLKLALKGIKNES